MPYTKKKKKKIKQFKAPQGMSDVLPKDRKYWKPLLKAGNFLAQAYGFSRIELPILEETDLFANDTGEFSDIMDKEMFSLTTKDGKKLTICPEFTSNVVRAYLEHGLIAKRQPVKLYYVGSVFRHEKPQAGCYRQFTQMGFEILGHDSPALDAQIIQLIVLILNKLGLKDFVVHINSIGCKECRSEYIKLLLRYYCTQKSSLCKDCLRRMKKNPLCLLDCKKKRCSFIAKQAPQMIDHLCSDCHEHFKSVLEFLDEIRILYELDPYLVRGLDYYTRTTFEIIPKNNGPSLAGGGRYDNLIELLGGKPRPGVGGALGLKRVIKEVKKKNIRVPRLKKPKLFLAQIGDLGKKQALKVFAELVEKGFKVKEEFSRNKLRSQLSLANKMDIDFVLILGQKEALDNEIIIRNMKTGAQETISQNKLITAIKKKLPK